MAKDFYEASKAVRDLFKEASEAASMDLKGLIFEGDEETLRQTRNTQISMVVAEAASASHGQRTGHNTCRGSWFLGWRMASPCRGKSHYQLRHVSIIVSERGRLMEEAGNRARGGTAMSAVYPLLRK